MTADKSDTPKRRRGRPASGRRETARIMLYLPPELDAAVREKIAETGQSMTSYFSSLARNDIQGK